MRALICLALVACSQDSTLVDADSLPTSEAPPPLVLTQVGEAVAGEPLTLRVTGAAPRSTVVIAVGASVSANATCPPGLPQCLDLVGATELVRGRADAAGVFERTIVVPVTAPTGSGRGLQAVNLAPFAASSAVAVTVRDDIGSFGVFSVMNGIATLEIDNQTATVETVPATILRFDNAAEYLIERAEAGPIVGQFNRVDWMFDGATLWTCSSYPTLTFTDALALPAPSRANVAAGGCANMAWVPAQRIDPAIAGSFVDEWGTAHTIDAATWDQGWGLWHISRYSNLSQNLIAQNDAANAFSPGLWSRFDWTEQAGDTWYCQTAYDAPTEWAARSTPRADAGDLLNGCAGFAWTLLTP